MTTSAFMLVRTLCSLALASTLFLAGCGQQPIVHTHSHTSGLGRPSSPTCTTAASATVAAEAFVQPGETVKSLGSDALGTMYQGQFANTPDYPDNYFYFFVYASDCQPDMAVGAISAATYLGISGGEFIFSTHPASPPTATQRPFLIKFDPVFGVSYYLWQDATVRSAPDIVVSNGPHLLGGRFTFSRFGQSLLLNLTLSPAKQ